MMPNGLAQSRSSIRYLICSLLVLFSISATAAQPVVNPAPSTLTVVMDDNYPPYIMRKPDGSLDGYLVDAWQLWQQKTGVRVELIAQDWATAQKTMRNGGADVIDTIFRTPQREQSMDFSAPYATLPVALYTHADITGITDVAALHGFVVGVKAGDACIDKLSAGGITNMEAYPSYDALVQASLANDIHVFCMDEPPANYLIRRAAANQRFRRAFIINQGEFHRAVRKGNAGTLALVERGFASFSETEQQALHDKWMGQGLSDPLHRTLVYGLQISAILLAALLAIILLLRSLVKRRTAALLSTTNQLQATLDALPDLLFEVDLNGRYLDYHSPRIDLLTAPADKLIGRTVAEMLPPDAADICMAALREAEEKGHSTGKQIELTLADGQYWFELSVARKTTPAQQIPSFIVLSRDITSRKTAEFKVGRLSKLYAAISQCNQAIVRCNNEAELFPIICRDAVNSGGFKMAWIGMLDEASRMIKPVASFGAGIEYLDGIEISVDADEPSSRGPTGTSVREDRPLWCQDFQHDPATAAWHERGARFGWGASAALPLHCKGVAVGALNLYADEANAFDEAAQNLLAEMALDISYALDNFALESEYKQTVMALQESEKKLRLFIRYAPSAIAMFDRDMRYLAYSRRWPVDYHLGKQELTGRSHYEVFPDIPERWKEVHRRSMAGAIERCDEDPFLRADGSVDWVRWETHPWRTSQGNIGGIIIFSEVITGRKQAEAELIKLSLAVEQNPNSIVITNLNGNIEYVNDAFVKMTGYSRDEVIGKDPHILQSGKTPEAIYADMWTQLTRGKVWRGELINKHRDGSEYIESAQISPVRQADGRITHYLAIEEDITEKKQAEKRIESLANFDQLTGLPNRIMLNDRFKYALSVVQRSGEPLAVMFLDLDHFKNINDTLGHTIGDQLLMEMAKRIKACLRDEDTVSRQGGDEFMLILHGTDADDAAYVAAKLIEVVSQPCQIMHHELITTASIGIAIYPHDGEDFETLTKNADVAMYRAKQAGRNNFRFYTPEMQAHSARNLQLANALRYALARNELQLHYQPQLSIQDGHIVGAEALLRWRHPELGMISPAEFIPIAEDSGLIIPIGEWVLRTASKQLRGWMDGGLPPMVMAVNLSSVQFRQANITELVTRILDEVQLPHEYLELELTEAVAMGDPLAAIKVMDKLHELGIRMSIDDFGTGYSSLSYLKKFKVHKLKIDQSFVRDITDDPEDKAIVSAIINMAGSLGIRTIAEGVETDGQLAFLRLQGCDEVQGYYFSKPLTAEQFEAFVKNN